MGSLFRSERMALCQMYIQPEAAYTSISELGELGVVQFRDLNPDLSTFQRKFVQEVRRCDEMERKLTYIESILNKNDIKIQPVGSKIPPAPNPRVIIDLEMQLEKAENELLELSENQVNLKSDYLELMEFRSVLEQTQPFLNVSETLNGVFDQTQMENITTQIQCDKGNLHYSAGILNRDRFPAFERMLWRISRGNIFVRRVDINTPMEDPTTGNELYKTVFVAFFQGEQLRVRVNKVCEGFRATLYTLPHGNTERNEMVKNIRMRLLDLNTILKQTEEHRIGLLVGLSRQIATWNVMVKKMKAIYHTLNMFNLDVTKKCLIGECWIPCDDLEPVQSALSKASTDVASTVPSFLNIIHHGKTVPPTFNRTNRFTKGFQNLIDSYGLATYGEINPALYTIITFPFLFAVMFGDMGHGLILLAFSGWMVLFEKKLMAKKSKNEIWNIFFGGRYIILLMGLFSVYTGLVYNDIFSISMNIFGSQWRVNFNESYIMENKALYLNPETDDLTDNVYALGMDPVWQLAANKIIFQNSFKMKISIIIGVVHMMFGIALSAVNHIYLKRKEEIFLNFLPQILFLILLFGYLSILMFTKWVMYSAKNPEFVLKPGCAPSVLILFISMVLFKDVDGLDNCNDYMFEGQKICQMVLVVLALLCIPWMLFGKPIYVITKRKRQNRTYGDIYNSSESNVASASPDDHEDEPMSEIFIHQAIHTIEYVLSTVSHTASYLRLWALSLAHAQLSEILWGRVLRIAFMPLPYYGGIVIFVIFGIWAGFTLSILVMMEGLSAFLHTLRLHWVEFMSKFYDGMGYPFQPFSLKAVIEESEE